MSSVVRVAILDDHQSIVDGYLYRLSNVAGVEVVGTAAYGEDLEPLLADHNVDVLLLDVNVPTSAENANPYPILYTIPKLLERYSDLKILVISMHEQRALIKAIMAAGASGYILKDDRDTIQELGSVVRLVANGGIHFSRQAHHKLSTKESESSRLTKRQLEALSLCATYPDATTADLSVRLGVAHSTTRNLLSGAYLQLGVRNKAAAIAKARQLGLITPESGSEYQAGSTPK
jgi:two-component system nitrate/nitrite response regulator NarL